MKNLLMISCASLVLLLSGCSEDVEKVALKSEIETAAKERFLLESQLAKKEAEIEGLNGRISEITKRENELASKLAGEQNALLLLRAEMEAAKVNFEAVQRQLGDASTKLAAYEAKLSKISIDFQASITFLNGDTKPVSSTEFIVLSRSLADIAKEAGVKRLEPYSVYTMHDSLASLLASTRERIELEKLFGGLAKYRVANFKTDMRGAAAPDIPSGNYWIFGIFRAGTTIVLWDAPMTVKNGANQIYLDAGNAAYAK